MKYFKMDFPQMLIFDLLAGGKFAIRAYDILTVTTQEVEGRNGCQVVYRRKDSDIGNVFLAHPIEEVVEAINKMEQD